MLLGLLRHEIRKKKLCVKLCGSAVGMPETVNAVPVTPHPQLLLYPRSSSAQSMLNSRRGTQDASIHSIIRPSGSTTFMPYDLDRGPRYIQSLVYGITALNFWLEYF